MPIATIDGLAIPYRIIGSTGPYVTLITGGRRAHTEFIGLAEKFAALGFRVLLHDRRNTGAADIRIAGDQGEEMLWAADLHALLQQIGAGPAFIGGSSSGARLALRFGLLYPAATRGLLLMRVTGGAFAAGRLPEMYYGQFIAAAQRGGMEAVCATDQYKERIAANPANKDRLMAMDPAEYIAILSTWREQFIAGADLPVMGVTEAELRGLKLPTLIIPGNDLTHSPQTGALAHGLIPGSRLHNLPIAATTEPLIEFAAWEPQEAEIAATGAAFMHEVMAG